MTAFRNKSRTAILAVALVGVFLLGSPGVEAHDFTASSTISIHYVDGKFQGRVRSSRSRCEKRLVKVFKARPNRPDIFIGQDRTNENGRYRVPKPARIKGEFYARATRRSGGKYGHKHRCRTALSRNIEAP